MAKAKGNAGTTDTTTDATAGGDGAQRSAPHTGESLDAAIALLPGEYKDVEFVVRGMKSFYGDLFTDEVERTVRAKFPTQTATDSSAAGDGAQGAVSAPAAAPAAVASPAQPKAAPVEKLIPIAYVGKKEAQDDPVAGTGLVWSPGVIHNVTREQAALLFNHPDVWVDDRPLRVQKRDPIKAGVKPQPELTEEETELLGRMPTMVDINVMDQAALQQYAMREFGMDLPTTMEIGEMRGQITQRIDGQRFDS